MWNGIIALLIKVLPLETILAKAITYLIDRIRKSKAADPIDRMRKSAVHLAELVSLFDSILADGVVDKAEVSQAKESIQDVRIKLIEAWSKQQPAKTLEAELEAA